MADETLTGHAALHLNHLCLTIPTRRVGSAGNRAATDYFADQVSASGFTVRTQSFDCIDWFSTGAKLKVIERSFNVKASPYSLGGRFEAPLKVIRSVDQLEKALLADTIVLLAGDIAREQLMPKNFPFYNPEGHQRIYTLLEEKGPAAIIAATGLNPELAGGEYPFPLIEDGDFDIPSAFMTDIEGEELAQLAGERALLDINARRVPSKGCNVIADKGRGERRLLFCAHIDAKAGSPGALDNGGGVVVLLLLARLLADYNGDLAVELLAINGEDYYAASGEIIYLEQQLDQFDQLLLAVNIDGAGYVEGRTAFSFYEVPDTLAAATRKSFAPFDDLVEGQPWFQSDHMVFAMNGVPALAFTSEMATAIWGDIPHTAKDQPGIVSHQKLTNLAIALRKLVDDLSRL